MVAGLSLAAVLVLLGLGTGWRQRRALARLAARRVVPSDERAYLRGQARRRLAVAGVLVVIGGMIGGSFLSGMEARADAIGDRGAAAGDGPRPPADPDDKAFFRFYTGYWIAVVVLVFAAGCLAVADFWATRRFWLRAYVQIRDDHNARLRRDLALHRTQKMDERETRIKKGLGDGGPPAGGG